VVVTSNDIYANAADGVRIEGGGGHLLQANEVASSGEHGVLIDDSSFNTLASGNDINGNLTCGRAPPGGGARSSNVVPPRPSPGSPPTPPANPIRSPRSSSAG
jgi:hypothetical protein